MKRESRADQQAIDDVERSVLAKNIAFLTPYAEDAKARGVTAEQFGEDTVRGVLIGQRENPGGSMVSPSGTHVSLDEMAMGACLRAIAEVSTRVWGVTVELHKVAPPSPAAP